MFCLRGDLRTHTSNPWIFFCRHTPPLAGALQEDVNIRNGEAVSDTYDGRGDGGVGMVNLGIIYGPRGRTPGENILVTLLGRRPLGQGHYLPWFSGGT